MRTHVHGFESSQLEGLYVEDLLHILIPKLIELYTLNTYSFLHVSHTSNVVKTNKQTKNRIIFFCLQRILLDKVNQETLDESTLFYRVSF